jgi:hypothetical protein
MNCDFVGASTSHACRSMNKTMFVKPVNAEGAKAKVSCMVIFYLFISIFYVSFPLSLVQKMGYFWGIYIYIYFST